jgi:glycosyltransferase involved in cell wall biosynthesis
MANEETCFEKFKRLKACVIIPTYNNAATIAAVISDVAAYSQDIIVVNDGSTDNTWQVLEQFPAIQKTSYKKNAGKGFALRKGFEAAVANGYAYAITIDSDGQHYAKDLPEFLNRLESEKNSIIIGERNLNQSNVPGKSSFGNKFSSFWFMVETGIKMQDTQSGYRLYPLLPLRKIHFITRKYEFEIEVLVRAAWRGVTISSMPVSVYYPPAAERVSHFRPLKDTVRISILNTILVLVAFLYIKPRDILRHIFDKEKGKEYINKHLLQNDQPDHIKSLSVAFGVFMGIIPIWGFQLIAAIFLSIVLRLNKALVIVAANISVPPMIPLIIFLSYKTGAWWMGANAMHFEFTAHIGLDSIRKNFEQYLAGSITLAIIAGLLAGILTFVLLKIFKRRKAMISL